MPSWPSILLLVRHGESAANVARQLAMDDDALEVALPTRDVDVPLSARGERQADALGHWFASQPPEARPTVVLASPYVRARATAERIVAAGGTARGAAFAPAEAPPPVWLASPYVRARATAERIVAAGGTARGAAFAPDELLLDERLREK